MLFWLTMGAVLNFEHLHNNQSRWLLLIELRLIASVSHLFLLVRSPAQAGGAVRERLKHSHKQRRKDHKAQHKVYAVDDSKALAACSRTRSKHLILILPVQQHCRVLESLWESSRDCGAAQNAVHASQLFVECGHNLNTWKPLNVPVY